MRQVKWIIALALLASACGCTAASKATARAECPPASAQMMWASDGQHWYNRDERNDGRCELDSRTKTEIIIAVVAGTVGLGILIPIVVWAVTQPKPTTGGGGGSSGGCPKCKVTKTRSDGVRQSYWVCC